MLARGFLLFIIGTLGSCSPAEEPNRSSNRPNILLIMADDMGYSDIGCYGSEISTPHLDSLAAQGLRFSQFYNTGRCCPTRASLLTGLYPAQTGVGFMMGDDHQPGYRGNLNRQCVTIAEVLKPAGYRTYMAGKWHVTNHREDIDSLKYNWPRQRGFDRFYGTITGANSYWDPYTLTRGNTYITPKNDSEYQPDQYYYIDAISDNAVRYVQQHKSDHSGAPFFMYVAYTAAHWPLHAPEEAITPYQGKYDQGYEPVRQGRFARLKELGLIRDSWSLTPPVAEWDTVQNKPWHARNMEVYAAMISRMDEGIGRIVGALRQANQLDNTLILFLQDNGACAEELEWLRSENALDTLSPEPTYVPLGKDDLQTVATPVQNRQGFPVVLQSEKVPAGSDQTYHAYGAAWAHVSNTPFREYKHWNQEGGIATPLIAHWPTQISERGEIRRQPTHLIDIMATCVEVANATYPTKHQGGVVIPPEGTSLVPVLTRNEILDRTLFFEHEGNRAVRQGQWKLVSRAYPNSGHFRQIDQLPQSEWELYNTEQDRTEMSDLSSTHPQLVEELSGLWQDWAVRTNAIPKPH